MRVVVPVVMEVSPENYNREYSGAPEGFSASEIREMLKMDVEDALIIAFNHLMPNGIQSIEVRK